MRHHGANGGPAASAAAVPPRGSEKAEGRPTAKSREPNFEGHSVQNFVNFSIFKDPKFQGTVRDELLKCGDGRGNKPLINRFQGNHRTEMRRYKGPGFQSLVIVNPVLCCCV